MLRGRIAFCLAAVLATVVVPLTLYPAGASAQTPPDPVIIVDGMASPALLYIPMTLRLQADGYEVWNFELPTLGLQDINLSAQALAAFVDNVLTQTGASKVDLVAHSQGGLASRVFIKYLGGTPKVDSLIMLGTPNQGTQLSSIASLVGSCVGIVGCSQMAVGSTFITDLNAGDDSLGDIVYTNIATRNDELVIPYTNSFLNAADGNITNKDVQSQCPLKVVLHTMMQVDAVVYSGIQDALAKQPIVFNCFAL
jgi:triacylglycerol lipase